MKSQRFKPILAILLFVIGASIYLLFRDRGHLGFYVLDAVGLGSSVDAARMYFSDWQLPEFVRFSLPDGLWASSYIILIDYLKDGENRLKRLFAAAIVPAMGVGSELLQYAGILPGVFDVFDLVCYFVPYIIYMVFVFRKNNINL